MGDPCSLDSDIAHFADNRPLLVITVLNHFALQDEGEAGALLVLMYGDHSSRVDDKYPRAKLLPLHTFKLIAKVEANERANLSDTLGLGRATERLVLSDLFFVVWDHTQVLMPMGSSRTRERMWRMTASQCAQGEEA